MDCVDHGLRGTSQGYARVRIGRGKQYLLHRLVYCKKVGIDIDELASSTVIRHTCDNTRCVNPAHLLEGTQADNVRDMYTRNREVILRGEHHGMSKIPDAVAIEIRNAYIPKLVGVRVLARRYGLSKSQIHNIVSRKSRA